MSGSNRTDRAHRLQRTSDHLQILIVIAAIAPIVLSMADVTGWGAVSVVIGSWFVFVADLVLSLKLRPGYLRTGWGRADLAIVIVTAPWFLLPGLQTTRFLTIARLARLSRIVLASRNLRLAAQVEASGGTTAGGRRDPGPPAVERRGAVDGHQAEA